MAIEFRWIKGLRIKCKTIKFIVDNKPLYSRDKKYLFINKTPKLQIMNNKKREGMKVQISVKREKTGKVKINREVMHKLLCEWAVN